MTNYYQIELVDVDPETFVIQPPKRNAPCPCRSGKKFKKCCALQMGSRSSYYSPAEVEEFEAFWTDILNYIIQKEKLGEALYRQGYNPNDETMLLYESVRQLREHPTLFDHYLKDRIKDPKEKFALKYWHYQFYYGFFMVLRYEAKGALLGTIEDDELKIFRVKNLRQPIDVLPPTIIITTLVPYKGKITIDGLTEVAPFQVNPTSYDFLYQKFQEVEANQGIIEASSSVDKDEKQSSFGQLMRLFFNTKSKSLK